MNHHRALHDHLLRLALATALLVAAALRGRSRRDERGDVPGWVMITVMSATVVVIIGTVAREQLREMLTSALNSVK